MQLLHAQSGDLNNRQFKKMEIIPDARIQIDTLPLDPHSITITDSLTGTRLDTALYSISGNIITWQIPIAQQAAFQQKKVIIWYRTLPPLFSRPYYHLDTLLLRKAEGETYIGFDYTPYEEKEDLLYTKGMKYDGSFARGISFGNNQSLVFNSEFNLQMAGKIGNDIEVLAAITDQNIPIQPEGNTQKLQEFDKIFIQLKRKNNTLLAGDYELARPNSYFMNYYKKLQGATLTNTSRIGEKGKLDTRFSVAAARGKFSRNILAQQEGNQGPYRLSGNEGERFIIILAGTERVWLDGILLTRGEDRDYIIDYNRGDITFTNKRLITKDSRVIVEFDYTNQQYFRSLSALSTTYERDKLQLSFHLYSEQDSKNFTGERPLDSLERATLRFSGDSTSNILVSGIDTVGTYDPARILYRLTDTLINGVVFDSVLVYSTDPLAAIYSARFTEVGEGQGNYIRLPAAANGQIFAWSAPDPITGNRTGTYEPIYRLTAPILQQMVTVGAAYKLPQGGNISTEIAVSNQDNNRFSDLGNDDNTGIAANVNWRQQWQLGKKEKGWTLLSGANYEFAQTNFRPLNPYRNAEFSRDWNTAVNPIRSNEHLSAAYVNIKKEGLGSVQLESGFFIRDSLYAGFRNAMKADLNWKGFHLDAQASLLESEATDGNSDFFRPKFNFSKTFEALDSWKIGVYGEREKNTRTQGDTITSQSFYYDLLKWYVESPVKDKYQAGGSLTRRLDYAPVHTSELDAFQQSTLANEWNINGKWTQNIRSQLIWNLTYRELKIVDSTLTTQKPNATYLGRLDYNWSALKNTFTSNTTYEIGSGQEQRVIYTYLRTEDGQGNFVWTDRNANEAIDQNEMDPANPVNQALANYIRVTLLSNEFTRTNNVQFNQSLRIDPRSQWGQEKGIRQLLSRFSTQSNWQINRRVRISEGVSAWNPFQLDIVDTALVAVNTITRNTLFFNRANPVYDLQLGQSGSWRKASLVSGFDSQQNDELFFRARWNPGTKFTTTWLFTKGNQNADSDTLLQKSYTIKYYKTEPELSWLPSASLRFIFTYKYQDSRNTLPVVQDSARINHFSLESTFSKSNKASLRVKASFASVVFTGLPNTPVEFAMLGGLQNGSNYLWTIAYDRLLGKNIQLGISYDGRKTGVAKMVHTGRASVRAIF
jgi:hypothetical protein